MKKDKLRISVLGTPTGNLTKKQGKVARAPFRLPSPASLMPIAASWISWAASVRRRGRRARGARWRWRGAVVRPANSVEPDGNRRPVLAMNADDQHSEDGSCLACQARRLIAGAASPGWWRRSTCDQLSQDRAPQGRDGQAAARVTASAAAVSPSVTTRLHRALQIALALALARILHKKWARMP